MTFHTALECVSKIFTLWLTRISLLRMLALRNFDVDSDHFLVLHNLIRFFMTVDKVGCINLEILTRKWMMIFISLLPIAVGLIRTDKILFWSVNNFKRTRIFYRLILRRLKWVLFFTECVRARLEIWRASAQLRLSDCVDFLFYFCAKPVTNCSPWLLHFGACLFVSNSYPSILLPALPLCNLHLLFSLWNFPFPEFSLL